MALTNPSSTPTSELQAAYNELRAFLTLRTGEDLLAAASPATATTPAAAEPADNLINKTLAISTILAPDGAFFTNDIPDILKELKLTADPAGGTQRGDINVYGAALSDYGNRKTLFSVVGLDQAKFSLNPSETAQVLAVSSRALDAKFFELQESLEPLNQQLQGKTAKQKTDGLTDARKKALQAEIAELKQKIDPITKKIDKINGEKHELQDRAEAFRSQTVAKSALPGNVNSADSAADPITNPHVALYRHVSNYSDPASAASDYCNVFFNAIDSINMSLCVPYFRMNIVDRFAKKKGRYSRLSLASFLRQSTDATGDKIFYEATPIIFNTSNTVQKKITSGKVVGMETFFAPQTLLPDPTEILSNPRRLDTSVPLLSLNSFSIGIESVGIALLSKKTADLSITLHDRSRLSDISPLVSVGNFSSLYFDIEWGWAHPHGEAKFDNPVARYLNSLRFREVFAPISYNMTMAENGAMTINIRLVGGTSIDAVNGSILNGGFLTRTYASQILDKLIKTEIREESGEKAATEEVRTVTQVLIDKSRTASMVDRSFIEEIWRYAGKERREPKDRQDLITRLTGILESSAYYKNEEIFDIIKKNMPPVTAYLPSDAIFSELKAKYGDTIADTDFTSIAGYLTLLVGMPLAATGLYSEVQIHTFKFNKAAGKMGEKLIADAPIRITDVFRHPDAAGSLAQNTSITNALTLLANHLSNPKQPIYGLSNQTEYSQIKVDDSKKTAGEPAAAAEAQVAPPDTFKKPAEFVTPSIRYIIRAVPAKEYAGGSKKSIADYESNPEKLIAQIIIYDSNSSPNFDKIIGAYGYEKLKGTDGNTITPDIAKDVFKRAFPSIVYGATNSMIKAINISTDINNAIGQQNMLDAGKAIFLGRSKSDASTDVGEISLFPGSVTVTMIGLPIIERGQEVYLDLGTGTTLDALYYVTSVKHDFKPGEFTTSLTLTYKGQGSVMSLTTMLEQFNKTLPPDGKPRIIKASEDPRAAREQYEAAVALLP